MKGVGAICDVTPQEINLAIIIPAYNEADGIGAVLSGVLKVLEKAGINAEIIVVDDGSSDETCAVAKGVVQGDQAGSVRIIRHDKNRGYGAALKTGIRATDAEWICITDSDGTYPSTSIPELYNISFSRGVDMVVGVRRGTKDATSFFRRTVKWLIGHFANYVASQRIPDFNSGLRVFRRDLAVMLLNVLPDGFSFTTTITLGLLMNGYSVDFVPIDFQKRVGKSKIAPIRDTLSFLRLIAMIGLYFAPLKVFGLLSFIIICTSISWGVISYSYFGKLADVSTLMIGLSGVQIGVLGLVAELINHRSPNTIRQKDVGGST